MRLPDVNVLVNAFRQDAPDHSRSVQWLGGVDISSEAYGVSDLVLSGFIRIVTHPRIVNPPSPLDSALDFAETLRNQPNATVLSPGVRHWQIFADLCRAAAARGNLVSDAYDAALAIESGSEWITIDGDYARFRGLRWRPPF
jgi:toxin-antitoxin system PIN domain toxin